MRRDSLGRRRVDGQERGLRPLQPRLPEGLLSRAVRAAMSADDWAALDELVRLAREAGEPTEPRALGAVIAELLAGAEAARAAEAGPAPRPISLPPAAEWLDWEMEKFRRRA